MLVKFQNYIHQSITYITKTIADLPRQIGLIALAALALLAGYFLITRLYLTFQGGMKNKDSDLFSSSEEISTIGSNTFFLPTSHSMTAPTEIEKETSQIPAATSIKEDLPGNRPEETNKKNDSIGEKLPLDKDNDQRKTSQLIDKTKGRKAKLEVPQEKVPDPKKNTPQKLPALNIKLSPETLKPVISLVEQLKHCHIPGSFLIQTAMLSCMGKVFKNESLNIDQNSKLNKAIDQAMAEGFKPKIDPTVYDLGSMTEDALEKAMLEIIKQTGLDKKYFSTSIQRAIKAGIILRASMESYKNAIHKAITEVTPETRDAVMDMQKLYTSYCSYLSLTFARATTMLGSLLLADGYKNEKLCQGWADKLTTAI